MDGVLLRKILQVPVQESFYLELGIMPIGVLIKPRWINFLHYLLLRNEEETLFRVFITQWRNPCKGDWTETAKENLEEFNIPCDFNFIRSKSKESFKTIVKVKAQEYALKILTEKQQKHSKMENLIYTQLKPQKYLSLETMQVEQIRNIFQDRTRKLQRKKSKCHLSIVP